MEIHYDDYAERSYETPSGTVGIYPVVGPDGRTMRVLDVNGTYQSATFLGDDYCDLPFLYYRKFDCLFEAHVPVRRVLVLGGGGCSYAKHLIATLPEVAVDSVEIDPMITAIARRWFFVDRLFEEYDLERSGRLNLIDGDARAWLDSCQTTYDVAVNDAFTGRKAARALATPAAMRSVHGRLSPGGLYLTNMISALEGRQAKPLVRYVRSLRRSFGHVWVIPCGRTAPEDVDNNVVIASDGAYHFSEAYQPTWL